jgi:hypothetical protein
MALMAVGLDANAYGILVSLVVFLAIDRRTISPHTSP